MAAKEIRTKIASIKNTSKITRAMEMVAASKMRRAQVQRTLTEAYAEKIREVVEHLALAHPEYKHSFLNVREVKRSGFIIITTDRGLCGPLNTNLLRLLLGKLREYDEKKIETDLCVIGHKGYNFLKRFGGNIVAHAEHLGDTPKASDLVGIVKIMLDQYREGAIDEILLVHNHFINTMTQKPAIMSLLPIVQKEIQKKTPPYYWDYIYEPDAKVLIETLLTRYIEMQVYQAVVENLACEQASRMIAMKNATENAGELIDELQLVYNKARQAAITKEIAEIVGGAAAV